MSSFQGFLKQSTAVNVTVLMIDSSDHITGKTGLTITKYVTKAAGTPAATTITTTELDSTNVKGIYKLAMSSSDVDTLGEFQLHLTATGADPADYKWEVSTYLPGEAATLQADQAVNTTKFGGTSVTGRDIGASVLLSSGSGTGQLDFTSGVVKANMTQILGTVLTETAGQIAAAFKQFFNIASPTSTMNLITAVTTATNLTNAPTAGDLTATMKTSVQTAADAAVTANASVVAIKAQTDKLTFDSDNFIESHPETPVAVATNADKTGYSLISAYDPAKTASQDSDMQTVLANLSGVKAQTDKMLFDSDNYIESHPETPVTVTTNNDKTGYALTSAYDPAKTTAQDSDMVVVLAKTNQLGFDSDSYVLSHPMTAITVGDVTLAASQPNYAPAKAGDAMTLTAAYDAAKTASQDSDMQTVLTDIASIPTATENADAVLKRDWTAVTGEASRSLLNAARFIRNKFSTTASPGFVTVYKEDDATVAYTKALTTDSDAQPIVEG